MQDRYTGLVVDKPERLRDSMVYNGHTIMTGQIWTNPHKAYYWQDCNMVWLEAGEKLLVTSIWTYKQIDNTAANIVLVSHWGQPGEMFPLDMITYWQRLD